MKSPIEWKKRMMQFKTMTTPHHCVHHMNQPMHYGKRETVHRNRKGRK